MHDTLPDQSGDPSLNNGQEPGNDRYRDHPRDAQNNQPAIVVGQSIINHGLDQEGLRQSNDGADNDDGRDDYQLCGSRA
jgi:hypothetical protein